MHSMACLAMASTGCLTVVNDGHISSAIIESSNPVMDKSFGMFLTSGDAEIEVHEISLNSEFNGRNTIQYCR